MSRMKVVLLLLASLIEPILAQAVVKPVSYTGPKSGAIQLRQAATRATPRTTTSWYSRCLVPDVDNGYFAIFGDPTFKRVVGALPHGEQIKLVCSAGFSLENNTHVGRYICQDSIWEAVITKPQRDFFNPGWCVPSLHGGDGGDGGNGGDGSTQVPRMIFEDWMRIHNKSYPDASTKNEAKRKFEENQDFVIATRRPNASSFDVSLNKFGDQNENDMRHGYYGYVGDPTQEDAGSDMDYDLSKRLNDSITRREIPASHDWRRLGAISQVRDQGPCRSSWAMAAAGALEAHAKIKAGGNLVTLSVQHLMQCDYSNHGCHTGNFNRAFRYVRNNIGGLLREGDMPYRQYSNTYCPFTKQDSLYASQFDRNSKQSYVRFPQNATIIAAAVAKEGPVVAAIDTSGKGFYLYTSGIYTGSVECDAANADHAMLIVGFGTATDGTPFWLVKNSFGVGWGEQGYIRVKRGENVCGIESHASMPLLVADFY